MYHTFNSNSWQQDLTPNFTPYAVDLLVRLYRKGDELVIQHRNPVGSEQALDLAHPRCSFCQREIPNGEGNICAYDDSHPGGHSLAKRVSRNLLKHPGQVFVVCWSCGENYQIRTKPWLPLSFNKRALRERFSRNVTEHAVKEVRK